MQALWQAAFAVAGLGAVACFVFFGLYKQWLKLPIFQQMTKDQQYSLFRLFFVLTFVFCVIGVAGYVLIQLFVPQHARAEASAVELVKLLRDRKQFISSAIDEKEKILVSDWKDALEAGKPVGAINEEIANLKKLRTAFNAASTKYLEALEGRELVRSHELLREIHALLDDAKTQNLFRERVVFGDKNKPVFIPSRALTQAFFGNLPPEMDGKLGETLPNPNPFIERGPLFPGAKM